MTIVQKFGPKLTLVQQIRIFPSVLPIDKDQKCTTLF